MCKYTYTLCSDRDKKCGCKYFIDEPQYCTDALTPTIKPNKKSHHHHHHSLFSSSSSLSPPPQSSSTHSRTPPHPWTKLLSFPPDSNNNIGGTPLDLIMPLTNAKADTVYTHFQAQDRFRPVLQCAHVEYVEVGRDGFCRFHSDYGVMMKISRAVREMEEEEKMAARERERERREKEEKGGVRKKGLKMLKAIVYAPYPVD